MASAPISALKLVVTLFPGFHPEIVELVLIQEVQELHLLGPGVGHHVGRVVDDLLQIPESDPQEIPQLTGKSLEEPDMHDGHGQLDVAHALSADLGEGDLDAATVTDVPTEPDPLELPAVALPILHRSEDPLAKKPIPLRFEGAVVDGLRLRDLTKRPAPDLLRGGDPELHEVEVGGLCIS